MLSRSCCSIFALLPLLLVGLLIGFVAGVLPKPVDDAAQGVWRFTVITVINTQLPEAVTLEELTVTDLSIDPTAPPKAILHATVRVEGGEPTTARVVALELFKRLAGHMVGPFGLGERITQIDLTVLPEEGDVPLLKVRVSLDNLLAWQTGTLSDAQFQQTWRAI